MHHDAFALRPLPENQDAALKSLSMLVRALDRGRITSVPAAQFRKGWYALFFLFPGLHPDGSLDGGEVESPVVDFGQNIPFPLDYVTPSFVESGWPVRLVPLSAEAWRRNEAGELADDELYCYEASLAGTFHQDPAALEQLAESRRADQDG